MLGAMLERRMLQGVVATLAAIPVAAGLSGIVFGPSFVRAESPWPVDLDSHFRFLSGVFVAIGLAWYSCVPRIERKSSRFQLLAILTFSGGLARLSSFVVAGTPSAGHVAGLVVELIFVPLLVLWQARVALTPRS